MTMRAKRYQNSAALLIFMRRTTIPHSSFLISHLSKAFIHNQRAVRPPANQKYVMMLSHHDVFFISSHTRSLLSV